MKTLQMYHMKDSCPHSALPVWRNSKTEQRAAETNLASLETVGNSFMVWGCFSPAAATATPGNLYVGESNTVLSLISYSVESMDDWRKAKMSSLPLGSETVTDSGEIL